MSVGTVQAAEARIGKMMLSVDSNIKDTLARLTADWHRVDRLQLDEAAYVTEVTGFTPTGEFEATARDVLINKFTPERAAKMAALQAAVTALGGDILVRPVEEP